MLKHQGKPLFYVKNCRDRQVSPKIGVRTANRESNLKHEKIINAEENFLLHGESRKDK